ncbi:MAG: hypothetical protein ACK56I_20010, partial [bacterium]
MAALSFFQDGVSGINNQLIIAVPLLVQDGVPSIYFPENFQLPIVFEYWLKLSKRLVQCQRPEEINTLSAIKIQYS